MDPFKELNRLYCELTWAIQDVIITVKDSGTTIVSKRAYINILEPGTVVKVNNRHYFYSCPSGRMNLEGVWTDEVSVSYSVHEFLCKVAEYDQPVEVVVEG